MGGGGEKGWGCGGRKCAVVGTPIPHSPHSGRHSIARCLWCIPRNHGAQCINATVPGTAFCADRLDIAILNADGDADVTFEYTLTWYEWWVVYLHVVEPEAEMKKALEAYSGKPVDVVQLGDGTTRFRVYGFAHLTDDGGYLTCTTPELKFSDSKKIVNRYWFHRFLKVDLSPEITEITFPEGDGERFFDAQKIPRIKHRIES